MKNLDFSLISRRLRDIRISKGLTQEYIANAIDVNTSHISNIENNRVKVSLQTLVNMCNVLDTTVDYILANEYESPADSLDVEIMRKLKDCSPETKEKILQIIQIL